MLRQLVTGSIKDLEQEIFNLIIEEKQEPLKPMVVLVGSNILGIYLRRKLASLGFSHAGVRFITLSELAYTLANYNQANSWSTEIGFILTSELLSEKDEQDFLSQKALTPVLYSLFEELENGSFSELNHSESPKLQLISQYYNKYRQYRKEFYHITDAMKAANFDIFPRVYGTKHLYIYGLSDLNQVQRNFLNQAIENLTVDVYVPWEDKLSYRYTEEYVRWLNSYKPIHKKALAESEYDSLLDFLKANLWTDLGIVKPDSSVKIFAAISSDAEGREIMRELMGRAEEGTPFYKMAILSRDLGQYRNILRRHLDKLGIPYYMSKAINLGDTPVVTSYLALLRIQVNGWQKDDVLSWLIQYFSFFYKDDIDEAVWRLLSSYMVDKYSFEDGLFQLKQNVSVLAEENGLVAEYLSSELDLISAGISLLRESLGRLPGKATWVEWADLSFNLVSSIYKEETEAREKLLLVLKKIRESKILKEVELENFIEIIELFISEQYIAYGRFGEGVFVGSVMEARGLSFDYVFVPGMLSSSFPLRARENPLLNDRERQLVNNKDSVLSLKANRSMEERYLFFQLLGSAKQGIMLTYPRFDMVKGRVLTPSPYLVDIGKVVSYKDVHLENLCKLEIVSWQSVSQPLENPLLALDEIEFNLAMLKAYPSYAGFLKNSDRLIANYDKAYRAMYDEELLSPFEGMVGETKLSSVSISGLESYAECPMGYFFSRVLDLRIEDTVLWSGLDALSKGQLVHKILEDFYYNNELPLKRERLGEYLEQIAELVNKELSQGPVSQIFFASEREGLIGDLQGWLLMAEGLYDEPYVPHYFELPVEFSYADVVLGGRVDRLDLGSDGSFVLVDYKTGKSFSSKDNSFQQGEALQLPIYLLAIQKKYGLDLAKGEARYVGVSRASQYKIVHFEGEEILKRQEELETILKGLLSGIKQGAFHFNPGQHCRYCEYRYICNQDRKRLFDNKKSDPSLKCFLAVKEVE